MAELLEVKHLSVSFDTPEGEVEAVRDVSFFVKKEETLAIVGESGCGKSVLCRSIMKLLPRTARIKSGSILANGREIIKCTEKEMQTIRGSFFSMVFQDPMTSLNPAMTVGAQIAEAVLIHRPELSREEVRRRVWELMELVGIDHPKERAAQYPWNFSGGMRQRAVLAIALASEPAVLLADEPTTALDVTIQAQILALFRKIQEKLGTAIVLVSHDLGVVAAAADRVAVMYAGKICETGLVREIFEDPKHPYTKGLLRSLPALSRGKKELYCLPGMPPKLNHPPAGDAFACRNPYALAVDYEKQPPMFQVTDTHYAATWLLDERAAEVRAKIEEEMSKGEKTMAIRSVREIGDEVLTKRCKEVKEMTPRTRQLIDDMLDTMYEENGVGLAASQVGILKRIVVIDVTGEDPYVLVNPRILETSGEQTGYEGCLSVPGKTGVVTRPNYVKVTAFDADMNPYELE